MRATVTQDICIELHLSKEQAEHLMELLKSDHKNAGWNTKYANMVHNTSIEIWRLLNDAGFRYDT